MANHKSALKNIRSSQSKRLRNRYQHKTTRTFMKKVAEAKDKKEGEELLKKVSALLDKLAKRKIIHKNKAANQKSRLARLVNAM